MSSMIKQLDSDEAIVLMYLADELPPRDRALVEQRLAGEPALQALLEEMQTAQDVINNRLAGADRHDRIGAPTRTQRLLRAEILRRRVVPAADRNERSVRWRLPAWAYPPAVAALLFVGFMIWWDRQDRTNNAPPPSPVAVQIDPDETSQEISPTDRSQTAMVQDDDGEPDSVAALGVTQLPDDEFLVQSLETSFMFDMYQDSLEEASEIALDDGSGLTESGPDDERYW